MNLFQSGVFTLHSGRQTTVRINCEALSDADLDVLARMAFHRLPPFGEVVGVPQGGLRFARALRPYAAGGPTLIADDVLTTGASMEQLRAQYPDALGVVLFRRGPCPAWVTALFTADALLAGDL